MLDNDKLRNALSRVQTTRNALMNALWDMNQATDGLITFQCIGPDLHAILKEGVALPPEVEKRCDVIIRQLPRGAIEWLKFRDGPLPTPTDPIPEQQVAP